MQTTIYVPVHRPARRSSVRPYQPIGCVSIGVAAAPLLTVRLTCSPLVVITMTTNCPADEQFDVGDDVAVAITYADAAGPYDPDTVRAVHRQPDGTETPYLYGTDAQLTRLDVGSYQLAVAVLASGRHIVRAEAVGAKNGAEEILFVVERSSIQNQG